MTHLITDGNGFEFDGLGGEMRMTLSSAKAAAALLRKIGRFMIKVTDGHLYSVYISIVPFFSPAPNSKHGVSVTDAGGAFMISVDRIGCAFLSFHNNPITVHTMDKYFPEFQKHFGESFTKLFIMFINQIGKYIVKDRTYTEGLLELTGQSNIHKDANACVPWD